MGRSLGRVIFWQKFEVELGMTQGWLGLFSSTPPKPTTLLWLTNGSEITLQLLSAELGKFSVWAFWQGNVTRHRRAALRKYYI